VSPIEILLPPNVVAVGVRVYHQHAPFLHGFGFGFWLERHLERQRDLNPRFLPAMFSFQVFPPRKRCTTHPAPPIPHGDNPVDQKNKPKRLIEISNRVASVGFSGRRIVKVVFMDADGVLNNRTTMDRYPPSTSNPAHVVKPPCVAALNRITDTTGAWIVVTSTWRNDPECQARSTMQMHLAARGVTGLVEGCTPRLAYRTRGEEIQAWLDANNYKYKSLTFVVVDDDSDVAPFEDKFVPTSFETGMTEADADRAIELLGGPDAG